MSKVVGGVEVAYTFATKRGRFVKYRYIELARKRFRLTEDDGVSDSAFFGRK